jgi:hypothetical protein
MACAPTHLFQIVAEGLHQVKKVVPDMHKVMRLHA